MPRVRHVPFLALVPIVACGGERAAAPARSPAARTAPAASRGAAPDFAVPAAFAGCRPLRVDAASLVGAADTYTWSDASCAPRTATLLRNDGMDPFGGAGGYLRSYTYWVGAQTRTCVGTGVGGWNGFGYVVSHFDRSAVHTQKTMGTHAIVLAGRHHAIHEFRWRISPGGPVDVTAHWFFATGRDHPVFAITWDTTAAGKDAVRADARAPYGDLAWDGVSGPVDGVAWGDAKRFTTKGPGPLRPDSAWDYAEDNTIPFVMTWSDAADAEMGLVQTEAWATALAGGDYGGGVLMQLWGKSGTKLLADVTDWLWPYQANQWELRESTTSHRLAWGSTYGAVGQSKIVAFGRERSGWPFFSYSVFVVLGAHSARTVDRQVAELAGVQRATLVATRGVLEARGPAGVRRTDLAARTPPGWDPTYAAWRARAERGGVTLVFSSPTAPIRHALLAIDGWEGGEPRVTLDGATLVPDGQFFATVDRPRKTLWLTLAVELTGTATLAVDG
jgi:hypothetical protein